MIVVLSEYAKKISTQFSHKFCLCQNVWFSKSMVTYLIVGMKNHPICKLFVFPCNINLLHGLIHLTITPRKKSYGVRNFIAIRLNGCFIRVCKKSIIQNSRKFSIEFCHAPKWMVFQNRVTHYLICIIMFDSSQISCICNRIRLPQTSSFMTLKQHKL